MLVAGAPGHIRLGGWLGGWISAWHLCGWRCRILTESRASRARRWHRVNPSAEPLQRLHSSWR